MESVIHLLMGFIVLNFILKIGFYPRWGVWLAGIGCAVFLLAIGEWATEQSATEIASLFASRSRMLTFSVYITLESYVMMPSASTVSLKFYHTRLSSGRQSAGY